MYINPIQTFHNIYRHTRMWHTTNRHQRKSSFAKIKTICIITYFHFIIAIKNFRSTLQAIFYAKTSHCRKSTRDNLAQSTHRRFIKISFSGRIPRRFDLSVQVPPERGGLFRDKFPSCCETKPELRIFTPADENSIRKSSIIGNVSLSAREKNAPAQFANVNRIVGVREPQRNPTKEKEQNSGNNQSHIRL